MIEDTKQIVNKLFSETKNGMVKIGSEETGYWRFYVNFSTLIEGKNSSSNTSTPVLYIPNYDLFIEKIDKYLTKSMSFYGYDKKYFNLKESEFSEKLFMDLMANMSTIDFIDVYNYLDIRTKFLDYIPDKTNFALGKIQGANLCGKLSLNFSNLEAPYRFNIYLQDENHKSNLPHINFGIAYKKAYVYAIQNTQNKNSNPLSKKFDRYFRKLNKDVDMEDIVANVSTNALASLTIFSAYMREQGIEEIVAPDFLPLREHANRVAGFRKQVHKKEKQKYKDKHERDQFNMTNKFMYLFLRYNYHFETCTADYDYIKQEMHLNLNNDFTPTENTICSLDNLVSNSIKNIINENETERKK